jgi:hypothetical protein
MVFFEEELIEEKVELPVRGLSCIVNADASVFSSVTITTI